MGKKPPAGLMPLARQFSKDADFYECPCHAPHYRVRNSVYDWVPKGLMRSFGLSPRHLGFDRALTRLLGALDSVDAILLST